MSWRSTSQGIQNQWKPRISPKSTCTIYLALELCDLRTFGQPVDVGMAGRYIFMPEKMRGLLGWYQMGV
jgi:hypothetical protein